MNRPSVAPADQGEGRGDPALTKWFYGFDSWLVLGPGHTKDIENGSGPCLHGTQDEVGTMKHNWSARCQHYVTVWVSMWAYDMFSQ